MMTEILMLADPGELEKPAHRGFCIPKLPTTRKIARRFYRFRPQRLFREITGTGKKASCRLRLAFGPIGFFCQFEQQSGELLEQWMAEEKPVSDKAFDSTNCVDLPWTGRADDGTGRQLFAEEVARLRHNQIGLQRLRLPLTQAHECHRRSRSARHIVGDGDRKRVASFILPGLEMHDLRPADTDQDPQNLPAAYLLREGVVETCTALLDESKVESRREGDRLEVREDTCRRIGKVTAISVEVASGNCRMPPLIQTRDGLIELCAEIGIGDAAVPNPPTRVHRELGKVCKPSDLLGSYRFAARQSAKSIQVDRLLAFGSQICIQEGGVTHFVVSIVMNILGHVSV